jgi:hypothetical protein
MNTLFPSSGSKNKLSKKPVWNQVARKTRRIENDASNNSSIVACIIDAGKCLLSRCLATTEGDTHRYRVGRSHKPLLLFKIGEVGLKRTLGLAYAYTIIYRPLPSDGRLLWLLNVTVSVLFSVHYSAHTLLSVTLSFLSSVCPNILCRCTKQTIFGLCLT